MRMITITECVNYTLDTYVEMGWITTQRAKKLRREWYIQDWLLFISLPLLIIFLVLRGLHA